MHRPRQLPAARRGYASLNQSARWPELPEMATEQAKFQSICPFVVQCRKSAATNCAPAAVEKNIKTAAAALRNEIWKAAEQRRTPRRNDWDVLKITATFWTSIVL